ncbi:MAG TPA: exodeoxyribonuclease VII large subunit, partial [Candidatus Kapabacteria bacterium]|nr:exodeoxyribonuclease VII large subunit [Candidatus Kapabacteria bacterium]
SYSSRLAFVPEDGMKVIVMGRVTVYAPQGKYQIEVSQIQPAGLGDLFIAFEALKEKLNQLGYFDSSRKKPLPKLPLNIGIATSPTGAVIRDMKTTIERRFPKCTIYFRPTIVQGETAAEDIAKAISELEKSPAEVIIIGRGGGSIEDLWCFNTEIVANAIFNCKKPIISAVGHETDFTISDFVADVRAATPTAAAELVTPKLLDDIWEELTLYKLNFNRLLKNHINQKKQQIELNFGKYLKRIIANKINTFNQTIDSIDLQKLVSQLIQNKRNVLSNLELQISSNNPVRPLDKGFALLRHKGRIIKADEPISNFKSVQIIRKFDSADAKIINILPKELF